MNPIMAKINNITLGADPELFLQKIDKSEVVSAIGLIGGTKDNPKPISEKGHSIQEDNVLVEFNIPPSFTKEEFVDNIKYCLDYIEELANIEKLTSCIIASHLMDQKYLKCEKALEFGCEPDFNVYTESFNPPINSDTNIRSAGKMAARLYRNM